MSVITNTNYKYSCGFCSKIVNTNHKAVLCGIRLHWNHFKCSGLSLNEYCLLQSNIELWYCKQCIALIFPFFSVDDSELYTIAL